MRLRMMLFCVLVVFGGSLAGADILTVAYTADSGLWTLRWAITEANETPGDDTIIFLPELSGETFSPTSSLPTLTDDGTTIDGDIDNDGDPDITLDGTNMPGNGLIVASTATDCVIGGLSIVNCPTNGLKFLNCTNNHSQVVGCYLGINATDLAVERNGGHDILIDSSSYITVGGTSTSDRNVFATGGTSYTRAGVRIQDSSYITVKTNYFGILPNGTGAVGDGNYGVWMDDSSNCTIGSTTTNGNRFASLVYGVYVHGDSDDNTIAGNYFGLKADGGSWLGRIGVAIKLLGVTESGQDHGPGDNLIGGSSSSNKNVFANGKDLGTDLDEIGVLISGPGADSNDIRSNLFATNAAGTSRRPLYQGVVFGSGSGGNVIGGASLTAANYFHVCYDYNIAGRPVGGPAVTVSNGVNGNIIRYSEFWDTIEAYAGSTVTIRHNIIHEGGIYAESDDNCQVRVWYNEFSGDVGTCVKAEGDGVTLNLGGATKDPPADGGNEFDTDSTWFVYNATPNDVKAENNDWGTTNPNVIDARIYDHNDNASYGTVDYIPYEGMSSLAGAVSITSAAALPTPGGGAEIVFMLSSAATVDAQVINIAGRPVATIAVAKPAKAGLQRIVWGGAATKTGLAVPAGTYLVHITARDKDGAQSHALTRVSIRR